MCRESDIYTQGRCERKCNMSWSGSNQKSESKLDGMAMRKKEIENEINLKGKGEKT